MSGDAQRIARSWQKQFKPVAAVATLSRAKDGKDKGKSKDKSKGMPKGKGRGKKGAGKARGMSLDELKKSTACADCGQTGYWRGDPECPRKANVTTKDENDYDDEEAWDYEDDSW